MAISSSSLVTPALTDAVTADADSISEIQPLFALTAINGSEPIRRYYFPM
jgi:hypothetical protein